MSKVKVTTKAPAKKPITIGPCSPMQELVFKRATEVDFMIIGGSRGGGKSEVITQIPLMWKDDPRFNAMFVRTQYDQLMGAGGLWETAYKYYPLLGARPIKSPPPYYEFPSGAKVRYKSIANMDMAEKMRGLQLSYLGVDEITQVPKEALLFLLTILRSEAKMNSVCIGTCNPHKENWVYDLVKWYLDEEGFVDKNKNGTIRWYVVKDNDFIFADSEEWFNENMPETVNIVNQTTGETMYIPPKKFCFVQLTIFDNPINNCGLVWRHTLNNLFNCWKAKEPMLYADQQASLPSRKLQRLAVRRRAVSQWPLEMEGHSMSV